MHRRKQLWYSCLVVSVPKFMDRKTRRGEIDTFQRYSLLEEVVWWRMVRWCAGFLLDLKPMQRHNIERTGAYAGVDNWNRFVANKTHGFQTASPRRAWVHVRKPRYQTLAERDGCRVYTPQLQGGQAWVQGYKVLYPARIFGVWQGRQPFVRGSGLL